MAVLPQPAPGAPNPFVPETQIGRGRQPSSPALTNLNVPNPGNAAQQQIGRQPRQRPNPVGGGVPGPGSMPNPGNVAQQQAPQFGAPAQVLPVTVPPQDAVYYDNLARMNAAYQGVLNGYTRTVQQDQAAFTYGQQGALTQLGLRQTATRNQANAQGLLESGILGQRADLNTAGYNTQVGGLLARQQAGDQAAMNRKLAFEANMPLQQKQWLDEAIARAAAGDAANMPTTPSAGSPNGGGGPRRPGGGVGRRMAAGAGRVGAEALATHPAQRQTTGGAGAHDLGRMGTAPSAQALSGLTNRAVFGLGGNLRKQAARKVVKPRGY